MGRFVSVSGISAICAPIRFLLLTVLPVFNFLLLLCFLLLMLVLLLGTVVSCDLVVGILCCYELLFEDSAVLLLLLPCKSRMNGRMVSLTVGWVTDERADGIIDCGVGHG